MNSPANLIIDTNVLVIANNPSGPEMLSCREACLERIKEIKNQKYIPVLDRQGLILKEYNQNLGKAAPGAGRELLIWLLRNQHYIDRCRLVTITQLDVENSFAEFPQDRDLDSFDKSDRKFVAVALAHEDKPPIVVAVDRGWGRHEQALNKYGVVIDFLCPEHKTTK